MRLKQISEPGAMLGALVLAGWPVWRWYAWRTMDGSDEPCGLLALATLLVIAWRNGMHVPRDKHRWIAAAMLLCIYIGTFRMLSPLPRAILMVASFGILCFPKRDALALGALLGLSLPVVATAQFYFGYPLRVLAGSASVGALQLLGFVVSQEGSLLQWRGETIMVDAPCSGVRMLWFGLYLAACIAGWNRLDNRRTLGVFVIALPLVIGANVVRAVALFFKEAGIVALPDWTHAAIGTAIFGAAALFIVRFARREEETPCSV